MRKAQAVLGCVRCDQICHFLFASSINCVKTNELQTLMKNAFLKCEVCSGVNCLFIVLLLYLGFRIELVGRCVGSHLRLGLWLFQETRYACYVSVLSMPITEPTTYCSPYTSSPVARSNTETMIQITWTPMNLGLQAYYVRPQCYVVGSKF